MRLIDADALIADMSERYCKPCKANGEDHHEVRCRACWVDDAIDDIDGFGDNAIEPKQADDLISRADAIDILRDYQSRQDAHIGMSSDSDVYAYARGMLIGICNNIKDIPSAQPKRGEWIVKQSGFAECSVCEQDYFSDYNFCPNCGARMTERSE